jgi:hypothetical protein
MIVLLLPFIWMLHCCNILSAYPQASDEQPSNACLLGISSRKVYPQLPSPIIIVRSYRTFSPLPFAKQPAVIFCGTVCILSFQKEPHPLDGALLYAVRTFLYFLRNSGSTGL